MASGVASALVSRTTDEELQQLNALADGYNWRSTSTIELTFPTTLGHPGEPVLQAARDLNRPCEKNHPCVFTHVDASPTPSPGDQHRE